MLALVGRAVVLIRVRDAAACVDDEIAARQEPVRDADRLIERAARIVPQIEHQLLHALRDERLERAPQLVVRRLGIVADADVAALPVEHERALHRDDVVAAVVVEITDAADAPVRIARAAGEERAADDVRRLHEPDRVFGRGVVAHDEVVDLAVVVTGAAIHGVVGAAVARVELVVTVTAGAPNPVDSAPCPIVPRVP